MKTYSFLPIVQFINYSHLSLPSPGWLHFFTIGTPSTQYAITLKPGTIERYTWLCLEKNKTMLQFFMVENIQWSIWGIRIWDKLKVGSLLSPPCTYLILDLMFIPVFQLMRQRAFFHLSLPRTFVKQQSIIQVQVVIILWTVWYKNYLVTICRASFQCFKSKKIFLQEWWKTAPFEDKINLTKIHTNSEICGAELDVSTKDLPLRKTSFFYGQGVSSVTK